MCHFSNWWLVVVHAMRGIAWMFLRHDSEAQSPTAHCNKIFPPPLLSRFARLSSWRVCPHLCWDNLLVYPDFPGFICLNEINGHSCDQFLKFIPNCVELSLFGIPANRAHPKRDSAKRNTWLNNYYLKEHEAKQKHLASKLL